MRQIRPETRAAIRVARKEQRALIDAAIARGGMPSTSWIERLAELEARILGLEAFGTPHGNPSPHSQVVSRSR
jgi:hypothetical protein